jgi:hypothetical protein
MICTRNPKDFETLQPFIPTEDILKCVVKSMPHMKLPCNIGRRNDYAERRPGTLLICMEIPMTNPKGIPKRFNFMKGISFWQSAFTHGMLPDYHLYQSG